MQHTCHGWLDSYLVQFEPPVPTDLSEAEYIIHAYDNDVCVICLDYHSFHVFIVDAVYSVKKYSGISFPLSGLQARHICD